MARGDYLGEFELVVMLALDRLDLAYGKTVYQEIERVTGRADLTIPAVYVTLNRLEKKGLVESMLGGEDGGVEGGAEERTDGRPKKYYRVTEEGKHAVETSRSMLLRLFADTADQSA